MKKVRYPNLDDYDLSDYEELKGDILYKINGGTTMSSADQAAMAEACKNGDKEAQAEIKAKYETKDGSSTSAGAKGLATAASTSTAPTQTDAPTQTTALTHEQQDAMAKQDAEKKTGGAGSGGSYGSNSSSAYSGGGSSGGSSEASVVSSCDRYNYLSTLEHGQLCEMTRRNEGQKNNPLNEETQENLIYGHPISYKTLKADAAISGTENSKKTNANSFLEKHSRKIVNFLIPNGANFLNMQSPKTASLFRRDPQTKTLYNKSTADKPLFQACIGKREAFVIGYTGSAGVVINLNNLWDSGILLSGGLGMGAEKGFKLTGRSKLDQAIDVSRSTIDFTEPTSTADIEGWSLTAYPTAGLGISFDLGKEKFKGLQLGSIGGGVYLEGTTVITVGEVAEGLYNTGPFIMNQILDYSGLGRFVKFDYIELDGKR
ncbi:MAG: hypothetical protein VZR56_10290 [Treponema sp.]|nr:hypothetical protein [Treponema sp.]